MKGSIQWLVDLHTQTAATILAVAQCRVKPEDRLEIFSGERWEPVREPPGGVTGSTGFLVSSHYRFAPRKERRAHTLATFEAWLAGKIPGNVVFRRIGAPGWLTLVGAGVDAVHFGVGMAITWDDLLSSWEISANGPKGPWEPVAQVEP